MRAILPEDAPGLQLRPGVTGALAVSANDANVAAEMELACILDGPAFRGSSRSRAFLRFVVEEVLAGRQDALKERTIGVAILDKPSDYDTGADSSVRVRANEVRKRLASHYDTLAPKAGIRIELPSGSYVPRFVPIAPALPPRRAVEPPPMLLRQLAAPTLIAVFLALIAIRAGVESSDAFSRFWNHALGGRSEIAVVVDAGAGSSISPALADAAMPLEALAVSLQVPVHLLAAGSAPQAGSCVIRLSLAEKPADRESFRLGRAMVFRATPSDPTVWLWAENAESLRSAAQTLTSRSGFPEIE